MNFALLMLAALLIEAILGWPRWLFDRIRHPVVWIGALVSGLDGALNRDSHRVSFRQGLGVLALLIVVGIRRRAGTTRACTG